MTNRPVTSLHVCRRLISRILRVFIVFICGGIALDISIYSLANFGSQNGIPVLNTFFAKKGYPDSDARQAQFVYYVKKENGSAVELARRALLKKPLNAPVLRTLGLALERLGRVQEAAVVLRTANALGWRDTATLAWGLIDAAKFDDPMRVMEITDALTRREEATGVTQKVFSAALVEPRLRDALVVRLAQRPRWRLNFFNDAATRLEAGRVDGMAMMLNALAATDAPPTQDELLKFDGRMMQLGEYRQARDFWARTFHIAPGQLASIPFDNEFRRASTRDPATSASVFEWQINHDLDGLISFGEGPGAASLTVTPGGGNGATIASQTLMVRPGEHILRTRIIQGRGVTAPAGWTIACLPSKDPILRTLTYGEADELSELRFTVPAQGCEAQLLTLITLDRLNTQPVTITGVALH